MATFVTNIKKQANDYVQKLDWIKRKKMKPIEHANIPVFDIPENLEL